eukprot:274709-Pyramimonas_sp.AAC.2
MVATSTVVQNARGAVVPAEHARGGGDREAGDEPPPQVRVQRLLDNRRAVQHRDHVEQRGARHQPQCAARQPAKRRYPRVPQGPEAVHDKGDHGENGLNHAKSAYICTQKAM